jgi:hypothetical protein
VSTLGESAEAVSGPVQAKEHQRRIQGDGVERVRRNPKQLARRGDGRDDGYAGGKVAQRMAEGFGIQPTILPPTRFEGFQSSPSVRAHFFRIQAALPVSCMISGSDLVRTAAL